eukprot:CAMPEP_0194407786 /NCGR_PEP_ID=MMETSP0176-20130528/5758_1 /TAXON_ID=216777 /ORGANISM="Proboscia alata, Strain PI-D3" /LENGTH=625 /DNA_ID=CAMNT_0039207587 /DNA_START=80 /DNA_END=1960 /DNA_ORIENTATION=+
MGLLTAYDRGERDRFENRLGFYMAAVGSAVGFGNVWRFPSLCAKFGGAAFLIPYFLALVIIGIPVLFLEIGFGQYHQTGDVGVFGSFNKRLRGVGLCSVIAGYVLLTYYSMLIAWCWNAFFDSWSKDAPWKNDDLDGDAAYMYFLTNIAGISKFATKIIWANVGYSFLTWALVFVSIAFGKIWTGRITYFTMGFPFILLFVFLFRGISLKGATDGINLYIGGNSDINVLNDQPTVWTEAVTQIFFSLSVTFGTMTAYGSLVPRSEPAFLNTIVIACTNCTFSFIAGFAVFSSIGHLAYLKNVDVTEIENFTSFGLVFGTWPVVLATLPGGMHWVRLLFLNLILLGLDSAFSILEGVVTVMGDTTFFKDKPKWVVTLIFSVIGFVCSLLYANDAGLFFLDVIDYYINFMLLLIGFLETFSAGWMYGLEKQIEAVGTLPVASFMFANFGGTALGAGLGFGFKSWGAFFLASILFYVVFTGVAIGLMLSKTDLKSGLKVLYWQNVSELRTELEPVIGWVPDIWCFLIKHVIPQLLLILFINGTTAELENGKSKFGNYEGYAFMPYQLLGILSVVWIAVTFLVGVAAPGVYESFAIYENSGKEQSKKVADGDGKKVADGDGEQTEAEVA